MYVARQLASSLKKALRLFPAVLVTGPRQAGKTTFLLHELGRKANYVSFDDPLERGFALSDPNGFLDRFQGKPVILDEIQYVPDILPYLKIRIDKDRQRMGRWILTGSQQFHLMKNISESLAGRVAILELYPFGLLENPGSPPHSLSSMIWNGGYPEPALRPEKRDLWVRSYIQTYVERDIRQLQNVKDLRTFERFIGLLAAYHGHAFNTATLSRECGVSLPTIKSWAGILEASYLVHFLKPYFKNYGKRVVKTPKAYFLDSSLVCTMTRQPSGESALSGAMGGLLFEGFLVSEAVKIFAMRGQKADLFFWRTHDGLEVDLLISIGNQLLPVEIKLTATPSPKHMDTLNHFKQLMGGGTPSLGILVCQVGKITPMPSNNLAIPWNQFPQWLQKEISRNR